jgi:hypothetical protein
MGLFVAVSANATPAALQLERLARGTPSAVGHKQPDAPARQRDAVIGFPAVVFDSGTYARSLAQI